MGAVAAVVQPHRKNWPIGAVSRRVEAEQTSKAKRITKTMTTNKMITLKTMVVRLQHLKHVYLWVL